MRGLPFVTALCLTRNRRQWLPKAIRHFQNQRYPHKELLIVADGDDVRDLIPNDNRIRLIHIEEGRNIGQKRNFGASRARGEIIAHWDDDDFSAPGRLDDQVARLLQSGKAVTGYSSMHFTDGSAWWLYRHDDHFAIGTSLCYRKTWWEAHPFQPINIDEDGQFQMFADSRGELVSCVAGRMMVAALHPDNTSGHYFDQACWKKDRRPEFIGSPCD